MWSQMLSSVVGFSLESVVVVLAVIIVIAVVALIVSRGRFKPQLEVEDLAENFKHLKQILEFEILDKKAFKQKSKEEKKKSKAEKKKPDGEKQRIFVLDFNGDIKASRVEGLRQEVSALLQIATAKDEVLVRLESPGGIVNAYGLAASQLQRIRDAGIPLTISVDKVAASGGYMMACVGTRILAAPFAILGSIGVVANIPNFHRLLKKHDVDYNEVTAGEYKRTVSIFGEITEPGMTKFRSQLEETHVLFKSYVEAHRPSVDIKKIATGEYWYGTQALALGLIDKVQTSDDFLLSLAGTHQLLRLRFNIKKHLAEKFAEAVSLAVDSAVDKLMYKKF